MKKQRVVIESNGTFRGTKLFINDQRIYYESLSLSGDKTCDFDLVIGLYQSKITKEASQGVVGSPAVGFVVPEEDCEDEYEEDE